MRAALAGDDRVIVVALGDEQRGAIRLTTALNGARVEFLKVETPLPVDPADGTLVTYEDLELAKLARRKSQQVIRPSYTPANTLTWCSL